MAEQRAIGLASERGGVHHQHCRARVDLIVGRRRIAPGTRGALLDERFVRRLAVDVDVGIGVVADPHGCHRCERPGLAHRLADLGVLPDHDARIHVVDDERELGG